MEKEGGHDNIGPEEVDLEGADHSTITAATWIDQWPTLRDFKKGCRVDHNVSDHSPHWTTMPSVAKTTGLTAALSPLQLGETGLQVLEPLGKVGETGSLPSQHPAEMGPFHHSNMGNMGSAMKGDVDFHRSTGPHSNLVR